MKAETTSGLVPMELITSKVYLFRGKKVMLDRDLADLYQVPTKILNQAVKRNIKRFPPDFMFQLKNDEFENWRSQIVTSNREKMGMRRKPYAFTENGIAMLSSVLNSERAIQVNVQIMRTFTKLRELMNIQSEFMRQLNKHEIHLMKHDRQFEKILKAIEETTLQPWPLSRKRIGFLPSEK